MRGKTLGTSSVSGYAAIIEKRNCGMSSLMRSVVIQRRRLPACRGAKGFDVDDCDIGCDDSALG